MNMTPRNLVLLFGAIALGLVVGFAFPLVGLLLLVPVVGFVLFVLFRNKGGSEADEATAAQARQFSATAGKAAIYVMRKGFVAGQQGMNVTIDADRTTQFRTGRFVKAEVAPGQHTIEAQMASQTKGTALVHTVDLAEGECVLLDAKLNMGALRGSIEFLETREANEARSKLAGLKLVEWKASAE